MKNPCDQYCRERKMLCRSSCPKYKEYKEWQIVKEKEEHNAFIVRDYVVNSVYHVKKVRRI